MSTKFEKRQLPETTVYTDEANTFSEKIILPLDEPTEEGEAINLKYFNEKKAEIDSEILLLKNPDRITINAGFTLVGQDLTMNPLWRGVIDNAEYGNASSQTITLPLSTPTKTRVDIIVLTKNNDFLRVEGIESLTNPPVPSVPNDTLLAITVIVNDSNIGDITQTITGDEFIKKSEYGNVLLTGSGIINQLDLVDEKATIVFKGSITRLNTISYASVPYNGKRITLFNAQATPVTIGHSVSGYGVDFVFANGQDYVLAQNETIEFSFDITYAPYAHHRLIGSKGIGTWSELQGKPSTFPPSAHTHTVSQITDFPTFKTIENQSIFGAGNIDLTKSDVGLSNVDNTSDANKPVSTATQTALNLKVSLTEKGAANGVATLGSDGKVPNSQIPALAISETYPVSSQTEMLALSQAEQGDVAIRSDISKSYILRVSPSSVLSNWSELLSPTDAVTSVNGQTGVVNLTKSMVGLGNVDNTSDLNKPISTATQTALNGKEPIIPTGTSLQYIKGDKTLGTFPTIPTVDQSIIDGSTNAVSGNAVFDALATKAPISQLHNPVTIGTANGLSLSTQQLSLGLASSGVTGALSGTDWNEFKGKFNTPSGLTTNYLPKWNGSGFENSIVREVGGELQVNGAFNVKLDTQLRKLRISNDLNDHISFFGSEFDTFGSGSKTTFINYIYGNNDYNLYTGNLLRFVVKGNGNTLFGKTNDAGDGIIQANGNITASPAVSPNQVVVKSQLDAVASSAGTSGTWSSNCSSADSKLTGITTKDSNYLKVGSIVNCSISGSFTGYTTSESYTDIQGVLPFNSTVIQPTYLGAAVIHIPATDEVIQAFIYTFGANGFRLRFKTPTGASKTGVFSVTFQYR